MLNQNFEEIATELLKAKGIGYFATVADLNNATGGEGGEGGVGAVGQIAYVGAVPPYTIYRGTGTSWESSGLTFTPTFDIDGYLKTADAAQLYAPKNGSSSNDFTAKDVAARTMTITDGLQVRGQAQFDEIECAGNATIKGNASVDGNMDVEGELTNGGEVVALAKDIPEQRVIVFDGVSAGHVTQSSAANFEEVVWMALDNCFGFLNNNVYYQNARGQEEYGEVAQGGKIVPWAGKIYIHEGHIYTWDGADFKSLHKRLEEMVATVVIVKN